MVQYAEHSHTFEFPFPTLAQAQNLRFPSPFSSHVLSSDVISRTWPTPNILRTTRLVLKRGKMPAWAPQVMLRVSTSWVLEEAELDLEGSGGGLELRVRSRNIDHKAVMEVFEWQTFREKAGDRLATDSHTVTRVTSEVGFWPVRNRIEAFGLSRVPKAGHKARSGLELVASLLLQPSTAPALLASGPLNPYPFESPPSALTLAVRAKLDEARLAMLQRAERERELREQELAAHADEPMRVGRGMALERDPPPLGAKGVWGGAGEGEEEYERGRVWRERWRAAVGRGVVRGKSVVCEWTGLLCDP